MDRFQVTTIEKKEWRGLADFWETTIFDRETGNAVSQAADTPAESFKIALNYLLAQNALTASRWRQQLATNDPTPELAQCAVRLHERCVFGTYCKETEVIYVLQQ